MKEGVGGGGGGGRKWGGGFQRACVYLKVFTSLDSAPKLWGRGVWSQSLTSLPYATNIIDNSVINPQPACGVRATVVSLSFVLFPCTGRIDMHSSRWPNEATPLLCKGFRKQNNILLSGLPQELSLVMYWGTHIFKATTSRAETRGRGRRNWLKITVAVGSSE